MSRSFLPALAAAALAAAPAGAAVRTEVVDYSANGVPLKGFLAYDDAAGGKRPGVLVVHEWWGLNDYARERARQLAGLGYVAFACDMYGAGKTAEHPEDAAKMAGEVRKNLPEWLARAKAGLKVLQDSPKVDADKLAAIGYCFGGSTAAQLALSSAPVKATVTFHGAPVAVSPEQAKAVKGAVLVCHGAADPFIKPEALEKFVGALQAGGAKVELASYPGVVHSFTVPTADKVGNPGMKYDAAADADSWARMRKALDEAFR